MTPPREPVFRPKSVSPDTLFHALIARGIIDERGRVLVRMPGDRDDKNEVADPASSPEPRP